MNHSRKKCHGHSFTDFTVTGFFAFSIIHFTISKMTWKKKKPLLEIRSDIKSGSLLGINPLDTHCEISNIKIA